MIAKRIERKQAKPFRPLAEYIAGAKEEGEKLEDLWIVNAHSGTGADDLDLAIIEIEATQALNTRVKANKSYHLVVSFRDEKPDLDALKDMEREFSKALGFEDHSRVVGTHSNTDNFHMHVAYSRIHPETFKAHMPGNDFYALEKVCRAMEKKYGLKVDHGIEVDAGKTLDPDLPPKKPVKVADMERHKWEKSFYSYVAENRPKLLKDVAGSKNWQELHKKIARNYGIGFKKRGNGLVIANLHGKETIKASSIDRSLSKKALEERFGPFEKSKETALSAAKSERGTAPARHGKRYAPSPLLKAPGQSPLWRKYMNIRRKDETLVGKAFKSWKQFLMADALGDVYAMAVINFYNRAFEDLGKIGVSPAFAGHSIPPHRDIRQDRHAAEKAADTAKTPQKGKRNRQNRGAGLKI